MWKDANFWVAIATGVMAFMTFIALRQNKKQLAELKHQWNESNRAKLVFSISSFGAVYCLCIENIGNSPAYNITFKINDAFLSKIPDCGSKQILIEKEKNKIWINQHTKKEFIIWPKIVDKWKDNEVIFYKDEIKSVLDQILDELVIIDGVYNDKFVVHEEFTIHNFSNGSIFDVSKSDFLNELKITNKELKTIKDSLKK